MNTTQYFDRQSKKKKEEEERNIWLFEISKFCYRDCMELYIHARNSNEFLPKLPVTKTRFINFGTQKDQWKAIDRKVRLEINRSPHDKAIYHRSSGRKPALPHEGDGWGY